MKIPLFVLVALLLGQVVEPPAGSALPCVGALHAKAMSAQEHKTPEGEWCQRPADRMSKKAHACACHQHNCLDPDPNHVSAHVDAKCLNYCTVSQCRCGVMDCP